MKENVIEGFVVFDAAKVPIGMLPSMQHAQRYIEAIEPDIVKQGSYVIHPISKCRVTVDTVRVDKFDLDGNLVETVDLTGDD